MDVLARLDSKRSCERFQFGAGWRTAGYDSVALMEGCR